MNSCGHHHLGAIGILGVNKNGEEWYQLTLGGRQGNQARIGEVIGRSFAAAEVPDVVERLIGVYLAQRHADERFIDTFDRIGDGALQECGICPNPISQKESRQWLSKIIKERRLQDDEWKVVNLVDGEAAIDVCLPVGPLLVPLAVWKAKKACLIHREYEHGTPLGIWLGPEDRAGRHCRRRR